jgi:general secretion pathway protein L
MGAYNDKPKNLHMTTLIVTLPNAPSDAASLYDYVLSTDGDTLTEQSRAPLALLPLTAKNGAEVVAVVAASQLSWHQVQLPKGSLGRGRFQEGGAMRLRTVLEGLLEERVLDDTAQLHFAIEPRPGPDAPVWVAVCDRAWLRAALQALEQSGRAVSRIVPEFAPEAFADTLFVIGEPQAAQIVCAVQGSVAVWPASPASVTLLNWPTGQRIVAEPALVALAEQLFKRTVTVQQSAQRWLLAAQSPWDLAQFDFVNSSRARTWKRWQLALGALWQAPRWRAARFAVLALLLVNLVGLNAWAWREKSLLEAQRTAIRGVLTSTFPKVQVVVDAPLQMAREVAALQQASGTPSDRDLDRMASAFMAVAPVGKAPEAIEFVAGELRMKGLILSPEEVAAISFKLRPQGYSASIEGDAVLLRQVSGS